MGLYKCRLLLAVAWLLSCQRTCGQVMRECRQKSDCSCSMSDGSGVVDFTSITGSGNAPRYARRHALSASFETLFAVHQFTVHFI